MSKINLAKKMQLLVACLLLLCVGLAACGSNSPTNPPAQQPTLAPPTPTNGATATPEATALPPTATVAPPTATPPKPTTVPTVAPTVTTVPTKPAENLPTVAPGQIGQELVGQLLAMKLRDGKPEVTIRITAVETFESLDNLSPVGIFVVALYDVVNLDTEPGFNGNIGSSISVQDAQGRKFDQAQNYGVLGGKLEKQDKVKYAPVDVTTAIIQPGDIYKSFLIFDLPKNAAGLKLFIKYDFNKSTRQPSENDFKVAPAGADSGAGQELVGQLIAADRSSNLLDVKVREIERKKDLKSGKKTATANGVYVIVLMDVANVGKVPVSTDVLALQDGKGRKFNAPIGSPALDVLQDADVKYYNYNSIQPGFSRPVVAVFDVPPDAANFKLIGKDDYKTSRQPNPDSFAKSGGKGNDTGAGQELIGKTLSNKEVDYKVIKVERAAELKSKGQTALKTDGVYLVVGFEVENKSAKEQNKESFILYDSTGRAFVPLTFLVFGFSLDADREYPDNSAPIKPGSKTTKYMLYEIPADASSLTLATR